MNATIFMQRLNVGGHIMYRASCDCGRTEIQTADENEALNDMIECIVNGYDVPANNIAIEKFYRD